MSHDHHTRIVQLPGGGGPFTVDLDTPTVGTTRVTDTQSGNYFDLPTSDTIYNADGVLTSVRIVDLGVNDLIFDGTGGGTFVIDGKLTVTGLIDPTGLEYTQVAANPGGVPGNTTWIDSADGRLKIGPDILLIESDLDAQVLGDHADVDLATVAPAVGETIVWDGTNFVPGVLAADNLYTADGTLTGSRTIDGASPFPGVGWDLSVDNVGAFEVNTILPTGGAGYIRVDADDAHLTWANGPDAGGFESRGVTQASRMYYASANGPVAVEVAVNVDGIDLVIDPFSDLRINGAPGAAGEVLTSAGPDLPPTWDAVPASDNVYTADGTLTGPRTIDGTSSFPGVGWDLSLANVGAFEVSTIFPTGGAGHIKVDANELDASWANGTESGGVKSDEASGETTLYYHSTSGAGANNELTINASRADINLDAASDLAINGDPGTAGEVLTSAGPGAPPTWQAGSTGAYYNAFSTLDWVNGGVDSTLTVPAATHGHSPGPCYAVTVFEQSGLDNIVTSVATSINSFTGDITLTVPSVDVFDGFIHVLS